MNAMAQLAGRESARVASIWSAEDNERHAARKAEAKARRKAQTQDARRLVCAFARQHGVKMPELLGKDDRRLGRSGELHLLRFECWAMLKAETTLSYPRIGRMFAGRDHTTIITGVKKHREAIEQKEAGQ